MSPRFINAGLVSPLSLSSASPLTCWAFQTWFPRDVLSSTYLKLSSLYPPFPPLHPVSLEDNAIFPGSIVCNLSITLPLFSLMAHSQVPDLSIFLDTPSFAFYPFCSLLCWLFRPTSTLAWIVAVASWSQIYPIRCCEYHFPQAPGTVGLVPVSLSSSGFLWPIDCKNHLVQCSNPCGV